MKLLITILLGLLSVVAAGSSNFLREDENGDEDRHFMFIPDGSGKVHLVNLQYDPNQAETRFNVENEVHFNLFTRSNPTVGQRLRMNNVYSIHNSQFDATHPTRFVVHGWNTKGDASINQDIRNSYLSRGDFNVIVVDWSAGSNNLYYPTAKRRVAQVGPFIARFIDFLVLNTGISTSSIHMAGHSLGAHVCGVAGRAVTRGKIHTIIGMDPALPLFSLNRPQERIDQNSADYVEIIHTNGGVLGFSSPLGHADFYPNGGKSQPGCGLDLIGSCAHSRAHQFFAEGIISDPGFWSWNCRDYNELMRGTCNIIDSMRPMGVIKGITSNHGLAEGIFYLKTHSNIPFAQGVVPGSTRMRSVVVEQES